MRGRGRVPDVEIVFLVSSRSLLNGTCQCFIVICFCRASPCNCLLCISVVLRYGIPIVRKKSRKNVILGCNGAPFTPKRLRMLRLFIRRNLFQ